MKWLAFACLAVVIAAGCGKQGTDPQSARRIAGTATLSSFDPPAPAEKPMAAHSIKFEQVDLDQVLNLYADISGRSVIRAPNLPAAKITFSNQTPMRAVEVLQALDTVLASQGIAMVVFGTQYVKAVLGKEAPQEAGPIVELKPDQLPDSSSFLIYIVKLKNVRAREAAPALAPFSKLPNSIVAINGYAKDPPPAKPTFQLLPARPLGAKDDIIILRDYSSNVRQMLRVLEQMEQR